MRKKQDLQDPDPESYCQGISQNLWVGVRGLCEAATSLPSQPLFSLPLVLSGPVQSSSAALYVLRRQDALGTPRLWEGDWLGFSSFRGGGPTHNKEACPRSLQSQLHMFPDSPPSLIHLFTHSIVITELAICQALEQG